MLEYHWIEITDVNAPELDVFSRLSEVQLMHYYEPKPGIFIAESANVILRALEAGYEPVPCFWKSKESRRKDGLFLKRSRSFWAGKGQKVSQFTWRSEKS